MFMSYFLAIIFYSRETWRSWKSWIIVLEKVLFGAPKILEFHRACPLGKQLSHFVCLGPLGFLLVLLMILLEDVLPELLPIGQVSYKSYSPSKKIYLSQVNRRDFFQALLLC